MIIFILPHLSVAHGSTQSTQRDGAPDPQTFVYHVCGDPEEVPLHTVLVFPPVDRAVIIRALNALSEQLVASCFIPIALYVVSAIEDGISDISRTGRFVFVLTVQD